MNRGLESPRRSYSDSNDDELAELMANSRRRRTKEIGDSDEDTEDASEDGDGPRPNEERSNKGRGISDIKEQVYQDKLALLKQQLKQLEDRTHPEYLRGVEKFTSIYNDRMRQNEAFEVLERAVIEREFMNEKKSALREFEDKKVELKENLLNELEEKLKNVDQERHNVELTADNTETKTPITRKLRRRPNEPVPAPEKRRKAPTCQITFILDEKEVDEDLVSMYKGRLAIQSTTKKQNLPNLSITEGNSSPSTKSRSKSPSPVPPTDIRIEDGKLFFEKRWFHRGQQIYLEGKETPRFSGVISAIGHDAIWVRKVGDNTKVRVLLLQLVKGKYSIKRRA